MLRRKLLLSSPEAWFGRPLRVVPDADLFRFYVAVAVAREIEGRG